MVIANGKRKYCDETKPTGRCMDEIESSVVLEK